MHKYCIDDIELVQVK